MLDVFQRLTSLLLYWYTQTFEGMPQQMLDLLFQFQIRRLKKLWGLINMFGASLHCLTRTEMSWWAISQMWRGGNSIEMEVCKKQSNQHIWPCQPFVDRFLFFVVLAALCTPTLDTDRFRAIPTHSVWLRWALDWIGIVVVENSFLLWCNVYQHWFHLLRKMVMMRSRSEEKVDEGIYKLRDLMAPWHWKLFPPQ